MHHHFDWLMTSFELLSSKQKISLDRWQIIIQGRRQHLKLDLDDFNQWRKEGGFCIRDAKDALEIQWVEIFKFFLTDWLCTIGPHLTPTYLLPYKKINDFVIQWGLVLSFEESMTQNQYTVQKMDLRGANCNELGTRT